MAKKTAAKKKSAKSTIGVTPLADRVLVQPLVAEERSPAGIIIPDSAKKEKPERGIVVAVGAGKCLETGEVTPMQVAVGDEILFSRYGFEEVTVDDTEYFIVSEASILAVIK